MPEAKRYTGSCHCGNVKYAVTTDLARVMDCNCSICSRRGHILTFVGSDQFELLSGADAVTDYQFNKMVIHHKFCSTCGIGAFGTGVGPGGKAMIAVNVRCLDGVDLGVLEVSHYDGKNL